MTFLQENSNFSHFFKIQRDSSQHIFYNLAITKTYNIFGNKSDRNVHAHIDGEASFGFSRFDSVFDEFPGVKSSLTFQLVSKPSLSCRVITFISNVNTYVKAVLIACA